MVINLQVGLTNAIMANSSIAHKVKLLRQQKAWSQSHLAEAAGVSIRTIQRLEKNGECSKETLLSIAAAFDVDVEEFTVLMKSEQNQTIPFATSSLSGINQKERGLWFYLRNRFSDKKRVWQRLMAISGGLLLILPVTFFLTGIIKYTLAFDGFPFPFEIFYSTEFIKGLWNIVSPIIFLGSLVLAFGLNLFPFLDFDLTNKDASLISSIRYQGSGWNWTILLVSITVATLMLGYVATESVAEHAIQSVILD